MTIRFRVLGCGDAFSSGGRYQTAFTLETAHATSLIDCGATTLMALQQGRHPPGSIDAVILSHLHGDHFGGLPFFLLHAHYVEKRTRPLVILGPEGAEARIREALRVFFPGSEALEWRFALTFRVLEPGPARQVGPFAVEVHEVDHPSGAPALGLRINAEGKCFAYSGDTRWTEALLRVGRDADLFVIECHTAQPNGGPHLDYETIHANRNAIGARRLMLTHLSESMLCRLGDIDLAALEDGLIIDL